MDTEVFFNTKEELWIFGCACLLGVFFGAVYNVARVVRAFFKHNRVMVFLEDFLYMLFVSLCFFVFSMELVRGQLRFFVLAGNLLGFSLFHLTAGNFVVMVARKTAFLLRKWIFMPIYGRIFQPMLMGFRKKLTKTTQVFVQKSKRLKKVKKVEKST